VITFIKEPMLKVKRIYDQPDPKDGYRVLVDRLWPRGIKKEEAKVDLWIMEIGPSNELREWFGHKPEKCAEFKRRYFKELNTKDALLKMIEERLREGTVTLVYAAKYEECNNATATKEYIEMRAAKKIVKRGEEKSVKGREETF